MNLRTICGILRRLVAAAPGIRKVYGHGVPIDLLEEAARSEGLTVGQQEAEAWVEWSPSTPVTDFPDGDFQAIAVVAPSCVQAPLEHIIGRRKATRYVTLADWVRGWPAGSLLAGAMKSDAVGARLARVAIPGCEELIFAREPHREGADVSRDRGRELAVTVIGLGYFPIMPATLVCGVMVFPALLLHVFLGPAIFCAVCFMVAVVSTVGCVMWEKWAGRFFLTEDPREFVLDEVAGMSLVWALLPEVAPWWGVLAGFLLFRLFDIFKWGVSWIERLPVRGRIVWDDLLASLYASLISLFIFHFLPL